MIFNKALFRAEEIRLSIFSRNLGRVDGLEATEQESRNQEVLREACLQTGHKWTWCCLAFWGHHPGQGHLIAQFQGHQSSWAARGGFSHCVRPESRHIQSLHPQNSLTHPTNFSTAASCPLLSHSHPMCSPLPRKPSFH